MQIPLFNLSAANATGFNGFERGLAGLELRRSVNAAQQDQYLKDLEFQGTLDYIDKFAQARANGSSFGQAGFDVANMAMNPFSGQAGLNQGFNIQNQQARAAVMNQFLGQQQSVFNQGPSQALVNAQGQVIGQVGNTGGQPVSIAQGPTLAQAAANAANTPQAFPQPNGQLQQTFVAATPQIQQTAAANNFVNPPAPVVQQAQQTTQTQAPLSQIQQNAEIARQAEIAFQQQEAARGRTAQAQITNPQTQPLEPVTTRGVPRPADIQGEENPLNSLFDFLEPDRTAGLFNIGGSFGSFA